MSDVSDEDVFFDGLPELKGQVDMVKKASNIRDWALLSVWEQGFHRNSKEFHRDCDRLPVEADWWVRNQDAAYEAVCDFLGYQTP